MDYLLKSKYGNQKSIPKPQGNLREMEIEFERNVSTVLDEKIKKLKNKGSYEELSRLTQIRNAFLNDQKLLKKIIRDYFTNIGIDLFPLKNSKYSSAFDLVYKENN